MTFFTLFTPVSYWILIALWLFIFAFYVNRIRNSRLKSRLYVTLLIILAIDAFRTLFESVYFGAWYTSLVGLIPRSIHNFLVRPEYVFIPKILNILAALLIILIVFRRWFPEEEAERKKEAVYTKALENEIRERQAIENELKQSRARLMDAQGLAKLGHYVFDIKKDAWTSSAGLDNIFGINKNFPRDVRGWLALVHPDDHDTMEAYLQETVLAEHKRFDKEYRIIDQATQKTKWVHGLGDIRLDEHHSPVELFGTIQDITEQVHMRTEREKLIRELRDALENVKTLSGLLPICAKCKKIRDDKGYWNTLEAYIQSHSNVLFSHGLCTDCSDDLYGKQEWYIKFKKDSNAN
ncbi:MAG: PAS domain-containing protein [Desulfobacter sp.]